MPWRYINAEVIHKYPWNQLVVYSHWTGMVEWKNGTAIALFSRSKVTYKSETQGISICTCIGIVKA